MVSYADEIAKRIHRWPIKREAKVGLALYAERLEDDGLPVIFDLSHLAWHTGLPAAFIASVVHDQSRYYREIEIPKRRGGVRRLSVPTPFLAALQRWILTEVLKGSRIHERAFGFVLGRSIVDNAKEHLGRDFVLKMDVRDFFGSISIFAVQSFFRSIGYTPKLSYALARICTLRDVLPQGSPASPALSNIALFEIDRIMNDFGMGNGLVYTRYADDITLSGQSIPEITFPFVKDLFERYGFILAEDKTLIAGPGQKKIVTGISISSGKLKLPRERRRKIAQEIFYIGKYGIQSHMHWAEIRDPVYRSKLLGLVQFWLQVEPDNATALRGRKMLRLRED